MQLKAAISVFFDEYSKLEAPALGGALRALSKDAAFVEQSEKLLDVEARFTLLTRLGAAREIPSGVMQRLNATVSRARKLRQQRDQIARNLMAAEQEPAIANLLSGRKQRSPGSRGSAYTHLADLHALWLPEIAQIDAYTAEAVELQHALGAFTEKVDQHLTAMRS